ncbi:MAG: Ig-like domain-containing protein [Lachnospira sp.]
MMEKLLKLKKYIKDWKVITACVAVVALIGGIAIYVTANSNVKFVFEMAGSGGLNYIKFDTAQTQKTIKILDFTGSDGGITNQSPTYDDYIDYVQWEINQKNGANISKNIIQFDNAKDAEKSVLYTQNLKNLFNNWDSSFCVNKQYVKDVQFSKVNPGKATITATYYSPEIQNGSRINYDYPQSMNVYVPLNLTVNVNGGGTFSSTTPYAMNTRFTFSTNAGQNNPAVFNYSNSDNIIIDGTPRYDLTSFKLNGGGYTTVTVNTEDCNTSVEPDKTLLLRSERILGEVKFFPNGYSGDNGALRTDLGNDTNHNPIKYFFIDKDTNFNSSIAIPSTVHDWNYNASGVTYEVEDEDICEFVDGVIKPKKAGITKITAGVRDSQGYITSDYFYVVVPFTVVSCPEVVNVGDEFDFVTTAGDTASLNVGPTASSSSYLYKIPDNKFGFRGLKAGKAEIVATLFFSDVDIENLFKEGYGDGWNRIVCPITIIDDFTIDIHEAYVSIGGEPVEIKALGTDTDYVKNPVGYEIVSQYGPNGPTDVVTGDLISIVKKEGTEDTFVISGLSGGTVNLRIYQTVNGVKKFDTCKIMVTTPVSDMIINPSEIKVDEGGVSENVVLSFEPEPTNNKVIWKSSDESIATIEEVDKHTIRVHGIKGGSTTINAISLDDTNKVVQAVVKVRKPITGLRIKNNDEADPESGILTLDYAAKQYQLVAEITPAKTSEDDGVNRNVTWRSSNPRVAEVDPVSGLVTFIGPGFVSITCDAEDKGADKNTIFSDSINLYITVPVETITLDTTKATIRKGDSLRITADVTPATASNKNLVWESSDTSVATVSDNGVVTAVGTGRCTILCKSSDPSSTASAMCNIFVMQPVTGIELNTTEITVRKGQVFWLNANCLPTDADDKSVTWSSNNEDICTVEQDGKVTAVEAGTTTIVAMSNDSGMLATCKVIVTQPVTGIKLNSSYQEMWVGSKYAIIPTVEPIDAENKNVTYFSSDSSVASVDEYGVVTALKGGNTIIEVTTEEYHLTATCTIVVKEYVSSITLSEHEKFLNVTETGTLTAVVETSTATNRGIIWSSSDDAVCSVDKDGNLSGNRVGNAVITATAADGSGVYDTCIVHVVNPVTKITVEPDTVRMLVGDSYIVRAVVEPENATIKDVDWSSSNESIAIVDEAGEIFALSTGKCKITATSKDGNNVKGSCWVYVTPVVNISSLKINSSEIYMLSGKSRQLAVRVRPANNTDSYDWYSTDTGIVTVNSNGVITTVGPGVADVVVESTANGVSSTCTVHSLAINRSSMRLEQYDSNYLDVIGIDSTDRVTWRSSNPRIATVDSSGKVVGRMSGTCNITAVTHDKTLYCTVTVFTAKKYNY